MAGDDEHLPEGEQVARPTPCSTMTPAIPAASWSALVLRDRSTGVAPSQAHQPGQAVPYQPPPAKPRRWSSPFGITLDHATASEENPRIANATRLFAVIGVLASVTAGTALTTAAEPPGRASVEKKLAEFPGLKGERPVRSRTEPQHVRSRHTRSTFCDSASIRWLWRHLRR